MIRRLLEADIRKKLKQFPAVVILGPRQVGKTTLAKQLASASKKASLYIDLERLSDLHKLDDAEAFLEAHRNKLVIIDEVQRKPELFSLLRSLIDDHRVSGRFLLLGSASPHLVKGVSESLAGRVYYSYLHPVSLPEVDGEAALKKHWFRGGFPKAFTATTDRASKDWLDAFITTYIERDLSYLFGTSFSSTTMMNFWSMLAHYHGGIWNAEVFAKSLGVSTPTVNRYLDFLEGAFLIQKLPAYFLNAKKRLVKTPKIYWRDSGVLHRLCQLSRFSDIHGNVIAGASWEGYVIEQIHQVKPSHIRLFYSRTHHGAESDLVLVKGSKPLACIEIKLSRVPTISKGFHETIADLGTKKNYVITPGTEDYVLTKQIRVMGLRDFLLAYLPKL